ncbi:Os05g0251700, partial [Oryza sativa Japonica Group]
MMQVRRNIFSWRVNGSMGKPQLCSSLMSHLRRKKLRMLAGMLSAGTIPAVIWILMPTKQMTTLSTTATAMARGVTSSLNSGDGCFSNTASTDVADMGSPIIASMAIKAPGQWRQPPG